MNSYGPSGYLVPVEDKFESTDPLAKVSKESGFALYDEPGEPASGDFLWGEVEELPFAYPLPDGTGDRTSVYDDTDEFAEPDLAPDSGADFG